jgi:hypothetical protein
MQDIIKLAQTIKNYFKITDEEMEDFENSMNRRLSILKESLIE